MPDASAPQGGETKTHEADDWPKIFNVLQYFEFGLVALLAICLSIMAGVWLLFILSGYGSEIYFRIGEAIREMT